jgi:DNA modification methylase
MDSAANQTPVKSEVSHIGQLKSDPKNARKHNPRNIGMIVDSLHEVGAARSIVIDENNFILAGNGTVDAAGEAGIERVRVVEADGQEIIAVRRRGLTKLQKRRLGLFDNRTAELADWDAEALLQATKEGFSLDGIFTEQETAELLKGILSPSVEDPGAQIDRAAELQAKWKTERGQVWQVGRHRLMCGDSTKAEDVASLLSGSVPFLCVTDPPYGVSYDPSWRNVEAAKGNLAYAPSRIGEVANDDRSDWREAWALFPGDVIYSWHPAGAPSLVHAAALQDSGFAIRMQIIWAKSNFVIGRGDYHVRHEPCWYAVREGKAARRTGDRTQTTLWEINLDRNVEGGHSTQKPLECMARPIRNHDVSEVYDPFLGSGTTMVAAEQLGRTCYSMEIEPKYVAVSLERLAGMGLEPKLVA